MDGIRMTMSSASKGLYTASCCGPGYELDLALASGNGGKTPRSLFSEASLEERYRIIRKALQFRKSCEQDPETAALGNINGWVLPSAPLPFFTTMLSEMDWQRSFGVGVHERTRFLVDAAQGGYRMTDATGCGPLLWAAKNSSFLTSEMGQTLAGLDPKPSRKDRLYKMDALGFVLVQGRPTKELAEILLDIGCDPKQHPQGDLSLFSKSCVERTLFRRSGDNPPWADLTPDLIDLLVSRGVDVSSAPKELIGLGRRDAAQIAEAVLLGWASWKAAKEKLMCESEPPASEGPSLDWSL